MRKLKVKIRSKIIGYIIGIIAGLALFLTGCGDASNSDSAGEEKKVVHLEREQIDDDGNVISSPQDMCNIAKDYLEDKSDLELKTLAAEALRENGIDPKLAENRIMTFGINFDIPEGFAPDQERANMWVTKRYPIEASNIIYAELDPDYTLQLMNTEYFEEIISKAFLTSGGDDIKVDITEFEQIEIDTIPAFRIKAEYNVADTHIKHLIIAINGSKTYVIIYTQTDEYDRTDLFEASAATISVKK